jgi:Asp-tRNA(Asn)/Glu-tRNA(Gln) amidotransferase B subunit
VLAEMLKTGVDPGTIIAEKGLSQISDAGEIMTVVDDVLDTFPDKVEAYRNGKTGLIGFFVGQVMSKTGGKANPTTVKEALSERLS